MDAMENENNWVSSELTTNSTHGCLRKSYENANLITTIHLEENRLNLLKKSLRFKRPIQSLRCRGFKALENSKLYIQSCETRANLKAIEEKSRHIKMLKRELDNYYKRISNDANNSLDENKMKVDNKLVYLQRQKHLKKLRHLQYLDETKWSDWSSKKVTVLNVESYDQLKCSRKQKRKLKAARRKLVKSERALVERGKYAIKKNLVINFTDIDIPLPSIAVLSYGPGWIPSPKFNQLKFKISGINCANKLAWSALFSKSQEENQNSEVASQTRYMSIPNALLRNEVTTECSTVKDKSVSYVKESIIKFASELTTPRKIVSNMNRFENEGLNWLLKAVKNRLIAITVADKGGSVLIVRPEIIQAKTTEKTK